MSLLTTFTEVAVQTNFPAVITLASTFGVTHQLLYLRAAYSNVGVGDVYVTVNFVEVFRSKVGAGVSINWTDLDINPGDDVTATLDAGGPFVTGTLTIQGVEL